MENHNPVVKTDIAIGAAVAACLLICHGAAYLGLQIQSLAACTAAVMCVQVGGKASWKAGLNRLLGVACGGGIGIALVLLDNVLQMGLVFPFLIGAGTALNLLLCRWVRLPAIQGRVGCMSLLLTALVLHGDQRVGYAFGRLLGTLVGAAVALLASMALAGIAGRETVHGQTN